MAIGVPDDGDMVPEGCELDPELIDRLARMVRTLGTDDDTWSDPADREPPPTAGHDAQYTRALLTGTVSRVWESARAEGLLRENASTTVLDHVILHAKEPLLPVNRELIALALEAIAGKLREK